MGLRIELAPRSFDDLERAEAKRPAKGIEKRATSSSVVTMPTIASSTHPRTYWTATMAFTTSAAAAAALIWNS